MAVSGFPRRHQWLKLYWMRRKWRLIAAFLCTLALTCGQLSYADKDEDTFDSAVFLLKSCTRVARDGRHNMLLRALRHLADPDLAPLFDSLVGSPYTPLRIHGFLGAAECDPKRELDLIRLASLSDPAEQAQIVSAAMDSDLLTTDQARQIIEWDGLDNAIKVLAAAQLIDQGGFDKRQIPAETIESENPARRGLALALLAQLGDDTALQQLDSLELPENPKRDRVRHMLLIAAMGHELDRLGPWALRISQEEGARRKLRLFALKTALRLKAPGASKVWLAQFRAAEETTGQQRLALMALDLSPWLDAEFFEPLLASEDPLVLQLGRTGHAVALKKGVADEAQALIDMNYPIANSSVLRYARKHADDADAAAILTALIKAYDKGPTRGRSQRLDDAVSATQLLFERDPAVATELLRPILASPKADPLLVQGILLGLIRCGTPEPHLVVQGLDPFENRPARNLALLLQARFGQGLSADALEDLGLMVRGGGLRQAALRVQAAWLYLRITNQIEPALENVLGNQDHERGDARRDRKPE